MSGISHWKVLLVRRRMWDQSAGRTKEQSALKSPRNNMSCQERADAELPAMPYQQATAGKQSFSCRAAYAYLGPPFLHHIQVDIVESINFGHSLAGRGMQRHQDYVFHLWEGRSSRHTERRFGYWHLPDGAGPRPFGIPCFGASFFGHYLTSADESWS